MKTLIAGALLALPCMANAALIEWVGTGEQTYYWQDQANPTATITILADENSIHRININNTNTSLTFEDPDVSFLYSNTVNAWTGSFLLRGHQPDYYAPDPDNETLLNTLIGFRIFEPEWANPLNYLDNVRIVEVGSDVREFEFTPTEWTRTVIDNGAVTVPEPASSALLALGLLGLGGRRMLAR